MTIHMLKLSVGTESIDTLQDWQDERMKIRRPNGKTGEVWHRTRMFPRRREEILEGGSMYWVIKGVIQVRQKIIELRTVTGDDGIERCEIVFNAQLIPVRPVPRRPFQGWRYLNTEDAPPDLSDGGPAAMDMPPAMRVELAELCLL
ncbi:MAG: DUF1489 family protein [Hyphomicrobiaceae bacterium]